MVVLCIEELLQKKVLIEIVTGPGKKSFPINKKKIKCQNLASYSELGNIFILYVMKHD